MAPVLLPGIRVGEVDFNQRLAESPHCIQHGHGSMAQASRVQYDGGGPVPGFLKPAYEFRFAVGLAELCRKAMGFSPRRHVFPYLSKRCAAIDLGLPFPQQIEVGTVQDIYRLSQRNSGESSLTAYTDRRSPRKLGRRQDHGS